MAAIGGQSATLNMPLRYAGGSRGAPVVTPLELQPSKGPVVGGILLWIVLILTALGTGFTVVTSSGAGRLWVVDSRELRRQQRFEHVLSLHVDATRLSRQEAASPVRPGENPVGVSACPDAEPLRVVREPCRPPFTRDHYGQCTFSLAADSTP